MKKKIIIISLIIIFIIIACILGLYLYYNYRDSQISLLNENIVIEYGKTYEPTINDLIDLNRYSYINLDKVTIENEIENEENKNYIGVGNYLIHIYYKNVELVQKVEVKDSIEPEITISESIELPFNTNLENYDFTDYIKINDLSKIKEYNIDFSNVNRKLAGEYIATIEVSDIYDNKTQKEFKIIIQEKVEETTTNETPSNVEIKTVSNQKKVQNNNTQKNNNIQNTNQISTTNNSSSKTNEKKDKQIQENTNNNQKCHNDNDDWFDSYEKAMKKVDAEFNMWQQKYDKGQCTKQEFLDRCPIGYEIFRCSCGKYKVVFAYL